MVADVSNELIYETLKQVQSDIASGQDIDKELLRRVSGIERMVSKFKQGTILGLRRADRGSAQPRQDPGTAGAT